MASASAPIDLRPERWVFYYQYHVFIKGASNHIVAHGTDNLLLILRTNQQDPAKTPFVTAQEIVFEEMIVSRDSIAAIRIGPTMVKFEVSELPTVKAEHRP